MNNNPTGHFITIEGRKYSYFSGNDYLGLAKNPEMVEAVVQSVRKHGVSFSASRRTTGTADIHLQLERMIATFKQEDDSIIFASGYVGNQLLLETLKSRYSAVFMDVMSHPSVLAGIPRDVVLVKHFDHRNINHLESLLKQNKHHQPLIITDGIFALTGEVAPLDQIDQLAKKYHAILIVDDAHATGVLGQNGMGSPAHFQLEKSDRIYQTETMSKALGSYGGFISSDSETIHKIRTTSLFYSATTALPPSSISAGIFAINYLENNPHLREQLMQNAAMIRKGIDHLGFITNQEITPIIPLYFKKQSTANQLSEYLKENGLIAPAVDYPVKTDDFLVRVTASANHTREQIEALLETLKKWTDHYESN